MLNLIPVENWQYTLRDLFASIASLFKPGTDATPNDLFIDGVGHCIPTRSGRVALYTALKALNLHAGARIGVPLFCCPVVFKAIESAGCHPVFIDVDEHSCCLSPNDLSQKINDIDAVIAVHMFGNVCEMDEILHIAGGRPVIEDCAQSLGSKYKGRMTGTIGAIGFFSFRSGKYISAGEGGALYTNNNAVRGKLVEYTMNLPKPGLSDELIHAAKTYIRTKLRRKPFYGIIGHRLWQSYGRMTDREKQSPIIFSRPYRTDLNVIEKRLNDLPAMIEAQRANAARLEEMLKQDGRRMTAAFDEGRDYCNRYLFPIMFSSSSQRDLAAVRFYDKGIATIRPYHDSASIAASHYEYKGDCHISERMMNELLVVPNHHDLLEKDITAIGDTFRDSFATLLQVSKIKKAEFI